MHVPGGGAGGGHVPHTGHASQHVHTGHASSHPAGGHTHNSHKAELEDGLWLIQGRQAKGQLSLNKRALVAAVATLTVFAVILVLLITLA
jgi:hypothetical protein